MQSLGGSLHGGYIRVDMLTIPNNVDFTDLKFIKKKEICKKRLRRLEGKQRLVGCAN